MPDPRKQPGETKRSDGELPLRDLLAAHALAGMLTQKFPGTPEAVGRLAYEYADALLVARNRPNTEQTIPRT